MSSTVGYTVTGFMIIAVFSGLALAIAHAVSLPDVHFSYSSQNCVKVVNYKPNDNYTCDDLPHRFYHVWEK